MIEENSPAAFEARYRRQADPWNFASSVYERHRYRCIMHALPRLTYGSAFEPGCSVGELTAQLAQVCRHVVATDVAPTAVACARRRCAGLDNVEIYCADIAQAIPAGPFDLIVFSEIGYYFEPPALARIVQSMAQRLAVGGDFVAVHWLGQSGDHVLHGDEVHAQLIAGLPLERRHGARHDGFRIDLWSRA